MGHSDGEHAGNGGVDDAGRSLDYRPNTTVVSGDAVDVVAQLKEKSEVPVRSHGSRGLLITS